MSLAETSEETLPASRQSSGETNAARFRQPRSGSTDDGITDSASVADIRFAAHLEILKEVAQRLSIAQFEEGESELGALIDRLDPVPDTEKLAFLHRFLDFSATNSFNPEVVSAFDTLWSNLSLASAAKIESASILAAHYTKNFEFAFALRQFVVLSDHDVTLSPALRSDKAFAQFSMGDYGGTIATLRPHLSRQIVEGATVPRRDYSLLFESFYRSGDFKAAESIGAAILQAFNDIQDWRDMAQFHEAIADESGLQSHLLAARARGWLDEQGQWQDTDPDQD